MAAGMVRCGACLRVFYADFDNSTESEEDPSDVDDAVIISDYWLQFEAYAPFLGPPRIEDVFEAAGSNEISEKSAGAADDKLSCSDSSETELHDELPAEDISASNDTIEPLRDPAHELLAQLEQTDLSSKPRTVWKIAALFCLVLLGFQYFWFGITHYGMDPDYRPYYEQVCPVLGCRLPEYANLSLLEASNLVVRTHPDEAGALQIDAIVRNLDSMAQPFPHLLLEFRDIRGLPVARRLFMPPEYLAGEMRGVRLIPAETEVRFSLEIEDPGERALSYSMEVRPPR